VIGSRFLATEAPSVYKVAAAHKPQGRISRFIHEAVDPFLVRHPKLSRFMTHVPCVSRFYSLPAIATVQHVAPVYNSRARKPRRPTLKM